jgi:hypothetical protein
VAAVLPERICQKRPTNTRYSSNSAQENKIWQHHKIQATSVIGQSASQPPHAIPQLRRTAELPHPRSRCRTIPRNDATDSDDARLMCRTLHKARWRNTVCICPKLHRPATKSSSKFASNKKQIAHKIDEALLGHHRQRIFAARPPTHRCLPTSSMHIPENLAPQLYHDVHDDTTRWYAAPPSRWQFRQLAVALLYELFHGTVNG